MDTIIEWIKNVVGLVFKTVIFSFIVGYLIGNYYATKSAILEPNTITIHNIMSMTLLRAFKTPGSEKFEYKTYEENIKKAK